MRIIILSALLLTFTSAQTFAQGAPPVNPKGWGERVNFGAREDHSLYPGPGNVVGGFRHNAARNDNGPGVASEIHEFMDEFGIPVADPFHD